MALVSTVSIGIKGAVGPRRTIPLYVPATATLSDVTAYIAALAPIVDAAVGGKLEDATVSLSVPLPGGLKGSADAGSDARVGANLSYDVEDSAFRHTIYIPTFDQAGLSSGDDVLSTGVYATLIGAFWDETATGDLATTTEEGSDLTAFIAGKKAFRK